MNYDFKDTNWFKEQVTKIASKLFICNSKTTIHSCSMKKEPTGKSGRLYCFKKEGFISFQ